MSKMFGDSFKNHFDDDGDSVLRSQLTRILEALLNVLGVLDTDRLAAQSLGHGDVIGPRIRRTLPRC